jgi:hypothetical protein
VKKERLKEAHKIMGQMGPYYLSEVVVQFFDSANLNLTHTHEDDEDDARKHNFYYHTRCKSPQNESNASSNNIT